MTLPRGRATSTSLTLGRATSVLRASTAMEVRIRASGVAAGTRPPPGPARTARAARPRTPPAAVLSGPPTTAGTYRFAVRASNGVSPDTVTGQLTIEVSAPPPGTVVA